MLLERNPSARPGLGMVMAHPVMAAHMERMQREGTGEVGGEGTPEGG